MSDALTQRVCTPAELAALTLERKGLSQWAIALHLGISRSAVRERLRNAARKVELAEHGIPPARDGLGIPEKESTT